MSAKKVNKGLSGLYKELETTRQKIEQQQQHETEVMETLSSAIDEEIVKTVRSYYHSDEELVHLLQEIQNGNMKIEIVTVKDDSKRNNLENNNSEFQITLND